MADSSADAGVVQSRFQLERLVADDELTGRQIVGFAARGALLRGLDLDGVTIERLDLQEAIGDDARLERAQIKQTDCRRSRWTGALWNRVQVAECDLTEIQFHGAQLLRCELGPVRMAKASFHKARLMSTTFNSRSCIRRTSRARC